MRSMTGYGRGECVKDGFKFTVELNSVNRKQSDIAINLPKELVELEPRIRDVINAQLSRGRINVVVAYHRGDVEGRGTDRTGRRAGQGVPPRDPETAETDEAQWLVDARHDPACARA